LFYISANCRKRGKYGPESRLSPMGESAISKSMRTAIDHRGEPVFKPATGMEFDSEKRQKTSTTFTLGKLGFGLEKDEAE